ncbi:MAG: hypothetical protein HQ445_09115 [Polaromonas sp.]|nr:hypothetical protein [Polaromonas sp.]
MATPENTFIASVHRHLPAGLYRMKNHNQFNGGIADVWYSGSKKDLWVEYKFLTIPKRDSTVVDVRSGKTPSLSPLQQGWLRARHAEGRSVGVIVGTKDGGVWFPGTVWDAALNAAEFRERLLSRSALACMIQKITQ